MKIVKLISDYSKSPLEKGLSDYLANKTDSLICCEEIKNKKFLLQYIKPVNDLIIHTTAMPGYNMKRLSD